MTSPIASPFTRFVPDTEPNADGQAHVAYFAGHTSFVWNGGDRIGVCPGGYGEPITAWIPAPHGAASMTAAQALLWIESAADLYLTGQHA